jgi:hypothetical protein
MILPVDVLEVDVLVVNVLELDVLGARHFLHLSDKTNLPISSGKLNWISL